MLRMGRGAQPFLGSWSLTTLSYSMTSLSNPQLSLFPFKFSLSLSIFLSASDDDAQSGFRKLRQKVVFFAHFALYLHNATKHCFDSFTTSACDDDSSCVLQDFFLVDSI